MMIGEVQPVTSRGIFLQMMGSRKTVPPRMFLKVPLGDFHIFFNLNSVTQVIEVILHLIFKFILKTFTFHSLFVWCDSGTFNSYVVLLHSLGAINRYLVIGGISIFHPQIKDVQFDVKKRQNELLLDNVPNDSRHFITKNIDNGTGCTCSYK